MKYFTVARLYDYKTKEEWFIHFLFDSTYNNEEDVDQHDEDLWKAYFNLPAVIACQKEIGKRTFASVDEWGYIRHRGEVDITPDLHLGKWVKSSPFYVNHRWQPCP